MDSEEKARADLLAGLRDGQPDAFRRLVEEHSRKVLNTCYRFVRNREDAEDVAQETFVEVHRSLSKFRRESDLRTWIYRIAVSKSLDFLRRQKRQKRGGPLRRLLGLNDAAAEIAAPSSSQPDVQLEDRERRRVLEEALAKLPRRQRVALILSKYQGLSQEEVAGILKTTVPSVEALVHRAKQSLQARLYDYYRKQS
jgi:RNA polymerase sigma-70 factor, ECF subfamily